MRTLMLVAIFAVPLGCAHRGAGNLAQRQSVSTPRGDFENGKRGPAPERAVKPVEPPIVTPPIP